MTVRFEQDTSDSSAPDFSLPKFFHDAYDKGLGSAIEEHPKEAAVTAFVGLAAICLTGGRALNTLFKSGAVEEVSQNLAGASQATLARSLRVTASSADDAARASTVRMPAWQGGLGIRRVSNFLDGGPGSSAESPYSMYAQTRLRLILPRGLSSEIRVAGTPIDDVLLPNQEALTAIRQLPPWLRQDEGLADSSYFDITAPNSSALKAILKLPTPLHGI